MQNNFVKYLLLMAMTYFLLGCNKDTSELFNTKKNNADQFLIEKKQPLVLPPEFNEMPTPETLNKNIDENEEELEEEETSKLNIKKLIKDKLIKKDADVTENTSSKFEGVEKKILDEINKN